MKLGALSAIIIFSEDISYVHGIYGMLNLMEINSFIERSVGYSDFIVLFEELMKEGFKQIEIIHDGKHPKDEFSRINELIEYQRTNLDKISIRQINLS